MSREISMYELLSMIKDYKDKLDNLYNLYINPETQNSRMMVSLYNKETRKTINGIDADRVSESIIKIDNIITETISRLAYLSIIKEKENASNTITIQDPSNNGETMTLTISQALILKSDTYKKYYLGYFDRLAGDYSKSHIALEAHHKNVLSEDKVSRYVESKINLLNMGNPDNNSFEKVKDSNLYKQFSKEYTDMNTFEILDPLNIGNGVIDKKQSFIDFYNSIDKEIRKFNINHIVEIDF